MRTSRLLLAVLALSLILPLLLAACGGSDELAQTSPETDREALVALYNATGGPNWERNGNWLSDEPVSEWFGVATDDNGRVTALDLDNNQLSGEIPPELGNLANLTELDLRFNQLSGEIPPELGNLANLEWLDLGLNQLSGEIPPELGNLANLTLAEPLGYNQLSGEIPPELGNLANLVALYLGTNELSGEIPPELGNLANLLELDLGDNQLSGCGSDYWSSRRGVAVNLPVCTPPDHIGDKEALVALYNATGGPNWESNDNWLSNAPVGEWHGVSVDAEGRVVDLLLGRNRLSGELPPELGNLANLQTLDLGFNQLSGEMPPELGDFDNLTWLYLGNNQLSGEIPPELGNLANLEWLGLGESQLSGELPPELGDLANLRVLYLDDNQLSGELPPELGSLANLRVLELDNNQLSGASQAVCRAGWTWVVRTWAISRSARDAPAHSSVLGGGVRDSRVWDKTRATASLRSRNPRRGRGAAATSAPSPQHRRPLTSIH